MLLNLITLLALAGGGALVFRTRRDLQFRRANRQQIIFVGETLADSALPDNRRSIVSLSTLPDRIANLGPTLTCLLNQTRPPDEIVIALPEFSVRQQETYTVPQFLLELPSVRILRAELDWGPATKFIAVIKDELAAGRSETLIMVVDDDRIYPPDAIASYRHYSAQLPDAALCFRGAAMPPQFRLA